MLEIPLPLGELVDLGFHHRRGLLQLLALALHHKVELEIKRYLLIRFDHSCVNVSDDISLPQI